MCIELEQRNKDLKYDARKAVTVTVEWLNDQISIKGKAPQGHLKGLAP